MLHQFLTTNRDLLIDRCRMQAMSRIESEPGVAWSHADLQFGIPVFIDQVIKTLRIEQTAESAAGKQVSGNVGGPAGGPSEIAVTASRHGRELSERGFTIDQVVHEYGDLCQAVTGLAFELDAPIKTEEFKILNRCLDNGIADAVTEFTLQRELVSGEREIQSLNLRLGVLAHELRNHLNSATLAFTLVKSGKVALSGATAAVLERSLVGMRGLLDRSLAEVRLQAGMPVHTQLVSIADFIAEIKASASLEAESRGCELVVRKVDPELAVSIDRHLLHSAVGNLLQNAFKFTRPGTQVTLKAEARGDCVRIEVQDRCGGLPQSVMKNLFVPFRQNGSDRSGVGLGLSISKHSVEANHGVLSVRDLPGCGCIFVIDLPRHSLVADPDSATSQADLTRPTPV